MKVILSLTFDLDSRQGFKYQRIEMKWSDLEFNQINAQINDLFKGLTTIIIWLTQDQFSFAEYIPISRAEIPKKFLEFSQEEKTENQQGIKVFK